MYSHTLHVMDSARHLKMVLRINVNIFIARKLAVVSLAPGHGNSCKVDEETQLELTQPMAKRLKLSGITCLVGEIKLKLLSQGPLAE